MGTKALPDFHVHLIAVHGGRCGERLALQTLPGHIFIQSGIETCRAGIVPDEAERVGRANPAECRGFCVSNDHLHTAFEQGITAVGRDLGDRAG